MTSFEWLLAILLVFGLRILVMIFGRLNQIIENTKRLNSDNAEIANLIAECRWKLEETSDSARETATAVVDAAYEAPTGRNEIVKQMGALKDSIERLDATLSVSVLATVESIEMNTRR